MKNPGLPETKSSLRGPAVFMPDDERVEIRHLEIQSEPEPVPPLPKRRSWLARAFLAVVGLVLSAVLVDWGWSLVISLGNKHPLAGQITFGLLVLLVFFGLLWLFMQLRALQRLKAVDGLRVQTDAVRAKPSPEGAKAALQALVAFYRDDPGTAMARAEIVAAPEGLHDPITLLDIAERALFAARDAEAQAAIAAAAQRVSIVTAASPRALVDVLFVLAQSIMLIRKLSSLYGGRAGGYGLWRLSTKVASHLAITGGVAVADSLLSQIVGTGLAARLSAKLGEGVLNGVLTARVGLAALSFCRPMSFSACEPIILSEVVKTSIYTTKAAEKPAA